MKWNVEALQWTRQPESYKISQDQIEVVTKPHTDLWQRTYYHFRNDNAPVLQLTTAEKYFSFVVRTEFSKHTKLTELCNDVLSDGVVTLNEYIDVLDLAKELGF